jgi:arylsulfatase A-like enzyme
MDTTRRDHLTLYGYPRPTSPHLAAFARRAAVYDDAWSVAPWTPSSHASMLTGLLPAWHGVDGETEPPLPADLLTLPEVLHDAGYRTAGFTANPNLIGPGWDQGFEVYRPPWLRGLHSLIEPLNFFTTGTRDIWRGSDMTARVLRSARRWWGRAGHDGDRGPGGDHPRFLFINLLDPHRPYAPPPRDYRTFLGATAPAEAYAVDQDPVTYHLKPGLNSRQRELLTGLYDAEIAAMDREIGRFLGWLAQRGELDRCLLVVTADHGERLGERGLVGHDLVMDEFLLRVPLLVRYPPAVPAGRVGRRVQLDGLPGYILHVAGVPAPPAMAASALQHPGRALAVAQYEDPQWFLDRMAQRDRRFDPAPYRGDWDFVAGERFAYVWSPWRARASGRLIDMAADPGWSRDAAPEHPEIARALDAVAERLPLFHRPEGGEAAAARALDRQEIEHLRSLGYVN